MSAEHRQSARARAVDASPSVPVYLPSSSIHGWLPTSCAVDEAAGLLYLVDDYSLIHTLSLDNGSLVRPAGRVLDAQGLSISIVSLTVGPSASHPVSLWLSVVQWADSTLPYLLLVNSSDLTVVRNVSSLDPAPPTVSFFSVAVAPSGVVFALVLSQMYVMDEAGLQTGYWAAPSGLLDVMTVAASGPPLLYLSSSHEDLSVVYVVSADGQLVDTVQLAVRPDRLGMLTLQLQADSAGRLWQMDDVDTVYAYNSSSGALLANFSSAPPGLGLGSHHFAIAAGGERLFVLTYHLAQVNEISPATGQQVALWECGQSAVWVPVALALDESQGTGVLSSLLIADFADALNSTFRRLSHAGRTVQRFQYPVDTDELVHSRDFAVLQADGCSADGLSAAPCDELLAVLDVGGRAGVCLRYHRNGTLLSSFPTPISMQIAVEREHGDSVWLPDFSQGTVNRYSLQGKLLSSYSTTDPPMQGLRGVAQFPEPDDSLLISDNLNRRLVHLAADGRLLNVTDQTQGLDAAWGIAIDLQRRVFVVQCLWPDDLHDPEPDYCWIKQLDDSGALQAEYRAEPTYSQVWLTVPVIATDGTLYAADIVNNRVLSWNTTHTHTPTARQS